MYIDDYVQNNVYIIDKHSNPRTYFHQSKYYLLQLLKITRLHEQWASDFVCPPKGLEHTLMLFHPSLFGTTLI